ncbi:integrase core domain-containing protein [Nocardia sp. NPDC049190]|uniref:integrase core domain-containing protein n=1 Tax=Nocardia sp. NPDC049190 TaxID=3155650 RepID=UPI0033DA4ABE
MAISRQNPRSTSRRSDGAPGDFIGDLPVNAAIHPAGLPINTSTFEVLQQPMESAQYTSISFTESTALQGLSASIGSVGDAYDNVLAESIIGLFKTEVVNRQGPFKTLAEVEYALMEWVDWYNNARLHSRLEYLTPTEYEAAYYAQNPARRPALV